MYKIHEIKAIIAGCNSVAELQKAFRLIVDYRTRPFPFLFSSWLTAAFLKRKFQIEKYETA